MVGAKGFEPSTSWSRTRRASQAALRPDRHAPPQNPSRNAQVSLAQRIQHIQSTASLGWSTAYGSGHQQATPRKLPAAVRRFKNIRARLTANKTAGGMNPPGGHSYKTRLSVSLELVAQCELHYARVRREPGVLTERRAK